MNEETKEMLEAVAQDAARNLEYLDAGSEEYVQTAKVMNEAVDRLQAKTDAENKDKQLKKQRRLDLAIGIGKGLIAVGTFAGTMAFQHYWNREYEEFEETGVARSTAHKEHRARGLKLPKFW